MTRLQRLKCRKCGKHPETIIELVPAGLEYEVVAGKVVGRLTPDLTLLPIAGVAARCVCGHQWPVKKVRSIEDLDPNFSRASVLGWDS